MGAPGAALAASLKHKEGCHERRLIAEEEQDPLRINYRPSGSARENANKETFNETAPQRLAILI